MANNLFVISNCWKCPLAKPYQDNHCSTYICQVTGKDISQYVDEIDQPKSCPLNKSQVTIIGFNQINNALRK